MWETLLELLQDHTIMSLAFLAWAWVVFHFGSKITAEIRDLSKKTQEMNYTLSNRLTKIEAHLEHSDDNFKPYRNGNP